jgi:hypothetical protein
MVPLTILSANTTGGNASGYQVNGTTGSQTVNPTMSAQWTVACKPQTQGNVDGTFTITSNAAVGGTANIALTCIGDQAR